MLPFLVAIGITLGTALLMHLGTFILPAGLIIAIGALIIGASVGWGVQHVITSLRYDERWEKVPKWKKRNLAATGAIAALASGLLILAGAPDFSPEEFLFRLWLWQTVSAPTGATVLDIIRSRVGGGGS